MFGVPVRLNALWVIFKGQGLKSVGQISQSQEENVEVVDATLIGGFLVIACVPNIDAKLVLSKKHF